MFLISKLEELNKINERYEKLSIEHALVTNSTSSVSQLEKENFEQCVHIRVGPTSVKRTKKRTQTSWPTKRKVMDKALVS